MNTGNELGEGGASALAIGATRGPGETSILLIDPTDASRTTLASRLRERGYAVEEAADPAFGAELAMRAPPSIVISDLWMPGISGVQLCHLLRAEPSTSELSLVLCGQGDDPRSRFWASRAGANAYVPKRKTAELLRLLQTFERAPDADEPFFFQLNGGSTAVRNRIARQLDRALFDSVIASEVRALASAGSFGALVDLLMRFLRQVTRYRWVALASAAPPLRAALRSVPGNAERAEREARDALGLSGDCTLQRADDTEARFGAGEVRPYVASVMVGQVEVGKLAMSPSDADCTETAELFRLVASELGGPLRVALLVEEAQRLACVDPLTGLANRRAFLDKMSTEISRSHRYDHPVSVLMLDVDHFKSVNDQHGHMAGDRVLAMVGNLLGQSLRSTDFAGRWGGEEFAVLLPHTDLAGARMVAERLRATLASRACPVGRPGPDGASLTLRVTASIGVAVLEPGETWGALVGRADQAMYAAKADGRNRVALALPQSD